MKTSSDPNTKPAPVAWYADPQPILFDQIEVGQGALFTRDELPEPVEVMGYDPTADAVRPWGEEAEQL